MASPTPDSIDLHIDALLPVEMARKAEAIGVKKATAPTLELLALAILAGAFIALGGLFATIAGSGAAGIMSYGVTRLLMGLVFCLGLILVVVGYSVSLFLLSLVVKTVPVGVAYAIWSGLGIVLVSIVALVVYQQKLDLPAIIGMGLIVAGVVFIQLFSKTAGH